ncbi:alpha/beta hydrolase family protein [Urbifossiella limnaea]|uniref:Alpha/beta hydrolase family protein n=1 Tax=Urbifossiella limnaea TaxID=2528023 RepID=A0A517XXJ5_9BACT|nr:alpha/beta fold hydrolase [Urbifossiella limnaea]QDU22236.1 Alpha/beta hydrolase family protein [Urbifossiella limnaea]
MFLTVLLATAAAAPAPPPRLVGEPVELATPTGILYGAIDLPPGAGPWPVVILHAGSGPTDRDGNGPLTRSNNLRMLGRALAARGVAVLRFDKRGIAASAKALAREEDIRLDTYAADVLGWAAALRADRRFGRVGFVGHSEGALIGLVAAGEARFDAFVSLCGPGRPLQEVLREQLRRGLPAELYKASDAVIRELEAGREVKDTPKELQALFRPSVQPYLISTFRRDPAALAAGLKAPLLVASGSTDIQVSEADARRLVAARPGARAAAVAGMNHVLKPVPTVDRLAQLPSYADPTLPLHPDLLPALDEFLRRELGPR